MNDGATPLNRSYNKKPINLKLLAQRKHSVYNTQFSSNKYFIFSLAVSDLAWNLVLALVWLTMNEIANVLNRNWLCQASVAITYICSFLSAAFTMLFTFQRFIAIVWPLRAVTSFALQSTRVIRRVIVIMVVFATVVYSFSLFLYDAEPRSMSGGGGDGNSSSSSSDVEVDPQCLTSAMVECGPKKNYDFLCPFLILRSTLF